MIMRKNRIIQSIFFAGLIVIIAGLSNMAIAEDKDRGEAFFISAENNVLPNWTLESNDPDGRLGYSVSSAGDVNGDGYADIIVGEPFYTESFYPQGRALAFYGSEDGLSDAPDWVMEPEKDNSRYGWDVACAGDVNGDGYDDVVVGAPMWDIDGYDNNGAVFVYHGSPNGLNTSPDWSYAELSGDSYGWSVASAGDTDIDGYDDLFVGVHLYGEAAYVYLGSDTGIVSPKDWTNPGAGSAVEPAGDIDEDGSGDIFVGAPNYSVSGDQLGRVYLYQGSFWGLEEDPQYIFEGEEHESEFGYGIAGGGDVNGDGKFDLAIGAPNRNGFNDIGGEVKCYSSVGGWSVVWTESIGTAGARYGASLDFIHDFNGDGYDDLIVGAHGLQKGGAFLYLGSNAGLKSSPAWSAESISYSDFGYSVSSAGDVNGDGYDDAIIGAPEYSNGEYEEGAIFLYYGNPLKCVIDDVTYALNAANPENNCLICDPFRSITYWSFDNGISCESDSVDCTIDICREGECVHESNNAYCDDDTWCNGNETCDAVSDCQVGTAPDCDDGVDCTDDLCNEDTDSCDNTANDANCDDGDWCDGLETCDAINDCQAGTAPDCDDAVDCTDDSCNEGTDSCDNTPNDANCDNGDWCDGIETCDAVSDCQVGTAPDCDDGVDCTDDSCNEGTDSCDNTANDGNCDNGDWCDGVETCAAINDCQAGTAPDCDDGVDCTDDSCNEDTDSCDNTANDVNCDNGDWCDGVETCDAVNDCQAGADPCGDDGFFCNGSESCDESNDQCRSGGDPCEDDENCNEDTDECDPHTDDDVNDDADDDIDDDVDDDVNDDIDDDDEADASGDDVDDDDDSSCCGR